MLTFDERRKLVERFCTGAMKQDELLKFTDMLEHDGELRELLDQESGVEALLHGCGSTTLADRRFEHALNRTVSMAPKTITRIPWVHLYALAASLLLIVMGGYQLSGWSQSKKLFDNSHSAAAQKDIKRNGKSIMRLTPNTLYLSEEGSKVKVVDDGDNVVNVVLQQGNICFEVGNGESRMITVATPHTAIVLGGTVTRVVVTELETEIAVLEGAAEVVHRYHRDAPQPLVAGSAVLADYTDMTFASALAPDVCESRTLLFRKYISWVQKQVHG